MTNNCSPLIRPAPGHQLLVRNKTSDGLVINGQRYRNSPPVETSLNVEKQRVSESGSDVSRASPAPVYLANEKDKRKQRVLNYERSEKSRPKRGHLKQSWFF